MSLPGLNPGRYAFTIQKSTLVDSIQVEPGFILGSFFCSVNRVIVFMCRNVATGDVGVQNSAQMTAYYASMKALNSKYLLLNRKGKPKVDSTKLALISRVIEVQKVVIQALFSK